MSVGRYWILTIPQAQYVPFLPAELAYVKGQLELGDGGFLHWQLIAVWPKSKCHLSLCYLYLTPVRRQTHCCQKTFRCCPRRTYKIRCCFGVRLEG